MNDTDREFDDIIRPQIRPQVERGISRSLANGHLHLTINHLVPYLWAPEDLYQWYLHRNPRRAAPGGPETA